uniref:Uncharacterized protein n=1 Tax=Anopheles culicifacies TaxID=139723 RepID=A0A182MRM9_9DIPT
MAFRRASYCCLALLLLLYLAAALAAGTTTGGPQPQASRGRSSNPSPRLPRTSASQLSAQNNTTATRGSTSRNLTSSAASTTSQAAQSRGNYRTRSKLILPNVVISDDESIGCHHQHANRSNSQSLRSIDHSIFDAFAGSSSAALNRFAAWLWRNGALIGQRSRLLSLLQHG